jgi:hypothetical protein
MKQRAAAQVSAPDSAWQALSWRRQISDMADLRSVKSALSRLGRFKLWVRNLTHLHVGTDRTTK